MEFKFEIDGRCFSLTVGYNTKWFMQMPQIMLVEEWYNEDMTVGYATVIWKKDKL